MHYVHHMPNWITERTSNYRHYLGGLWQKDHKVGPILPENNCMVRILVKYCMLAPSLPIESTNSLVLCIHVRI